MSEKVPDVDPKYQITWKGHCLNCGEEIPNIAGHKMLSRCPRCGFCESCD